MEFRPSGILKPGEAIARHRLSVILRSVVIIALASVALGVALAQGLGAIGGDLGDFDFWSPVAAISVMTILTVEVLKRRAPSLFSDLRGTLLSLAVGMGWGTLMHISPSFRMFDTLPDSITYGLISGVFASGVYDVAISPIQTALAKVGTSKSSVVEVITRNIPPEVQDEPVDRSDSFSARVATRDRTA